MSYDNKDAEYENGGPKKADVLIKSTQTIVEKQEELVGQTKLAVSRIDEAIDLCHKNSEEASYILEHSTKMFEKLQAENSAVKQELLYLAKQSENIYAGLAEKLNEMEEEALLKPRGNEVKSDESYNSLAAELAGIQDKISALTARIEALSSRKGDESLNDKFAILYDKIDSMATVPEKSGAPVDNKSVLDKLDQIVEHIRKTENAHSMLADKFEILSMRVEQFGFESSKAQAPVYSHPPVYPQPTPAYPVTVQTSSAEIDYDKLANKVAELLSVREAISPDYIASKVAEQIIIPEQTSEINTRKIAQEVAALIGTRAVVAEAAPVEINEESLADRIAEKLNVTADVAPVEINEESLADRIAEKLNITADVAPVEINEESLADKIAEKLNITADVAPVEINEESLADKIAERLSATVEEEPAEEAVEVEAEVEGDSEDALVEKIVSRLSEVIAQGNSIDQEELADSIALKVGSLRPDDFEIIVDDTGCASISKDIADKIDYNFISTMVADKLREILDINAANAPDYEDMAERISEKITVAGINEDAIAEKAAAVLSNYLPEFDTEEIADKVTGAVIDVVSAIPHPTVDNESICNEICERLIERQEDNSYDIVIDDEGIAKITTIVTEEIEKNTYERFDKLEDEIGKLNEMLAPEEIIEDESEEIVEETHEPLSDELIARLDRLEESINRISDMLGEEVVVEDEEDGHVEEVEQYIDDDLAARLDKLEDGIEKLHEMLSSEQIIEEVDDGEQVIDGDIAARLDAIDDSINRLSEMLVSAEVVEELEQPAEEAEAVHEEEAEVEYVSDASEELIARFDRFEEEIAKIYDLVSSMVVEDEGEEYSEEVEEAEETEGTEEAAEYADDEVSEEDYVAISDMVNSLSTRFETVEQKIDSLSELLTAEVEEGEEGEEEYTEGEEYTEEGYSHELSEEEYNVISDLITARFDSVEEKIAQISALVGGITVAGAVVSTDGNSVIYEQFEKVREDIAKIAEYIEGEVPVVTNERLDKLSVEIEKISQLVEGEISVETTARLDKLQEEVENLSKMVGVNTDGDSDKLDRVAGGVAEIKGMLIGGAMLAQKEESAPAAVEEVPEEEEESEELVTVSEIVKPIQIEGDDTDGDFILSALDMDSFNDDERMPGELGDLEGVDFENMMKYNRSFIARIIQSDDDCKQFYGEVKHALLSYKKVNSNVAWSNERFNKGRETIARMKIRGKTLVIYLALDPNEYKTSVYHHADVSDNNSVPGTPMMIKVKSPLGVRKAIRLIDEMLAKRGGEKREIPERDYAAMYPYETIEELIEDGLVKDVRKK